MRLIQSWFASALVFLSAAQIPVYANTNLAPLYADARALLQAGDTQRAEEQLWRVLELDPDHVGAWLDLAVIYCDKGWQRPAQKIFTQIRVRYVPPPEILAVIDDVERYRCQVPTNDLSRAFRVSAGFDTNANLGISHSQITLIDALGPYSLTLAPQSRPRESAWLEQELSIAQQTHGKQLWVSIRATEFTQVRTYDRLQAEAGLQLSHSKVDHTFFGQLTARDGRAEQVVIGWQGAARTIQPISIELSAGAYHYPRLSLTDHLQVEARGVLAQRLNPGTELSVALGYLVSQPVDAAAPGGYREGGSARGGISWRGGPWELSGRLFAYWLEDSRVYNPVIGPLRRKQDLLQGELRLSRQLGPGLLCGLSIQSSFSNDRVDLFDYKATRSGMVCERKI